MDPYDIIIKPIITEKTSKLGITDFVIVFQVRFNANKSQIKKAIEDIFKVKPKSVNTLIAHNSNIKKAYVKFKTQEDYDLVKTTLNII